jgi:hypothetical protein
MGNPAQPTFQGDDWSSWWNGQSKLPSVWRVPESKLLTADPGEVVCAIPLRRVPVDGDIDAGMVRAAPAVIDRMQEVKVPPACDEGTTAVVKPR